MQNEKLHSNWQQKIAGENLLGFVKYWLLGCQTVKWEIKKQNNQPPQPKTNTIISHARKENNSTMAFLKNKVTPYSILIIRLIIFNGRIFFKTLMRHSLVT